MANNSLSAESPLSLSSCQIHLIELMGEADARWADAHWRHMFERWRTEAAHVAFAALQRGKSDSDLELIETLLTNIGHCGVNDFASSAEALASAKQYADRGWPGVVAAMLLAPAWQATFLPGLKDAPRWLLPILATYVFNAPRIVTSEGQAQAYGRVYLSALEAFCGLIEANRGSAVAQAVLARFRPTEECPLVALDPAIHREVRIKRARIVAALNRQPTQFESFAAPRSNRPLRLGVIARTIENTPAALSLVRLLERLPPTRFAPTLLVEQASNSAAERQLNARGAVLTLIGGQMDQLAQAVQDANLDVAVFLLEGSWLGNPIAELLMRRLVPVQVVHDGTGLPSGFPHADLYTASAAAAPSAGERGVLVTPAGLVGSGEIHAEAAETWSRETLGMEGLGCVFGYFGELPSITPEVVSTWSRVLATVPESRLAIVAPPTPGVRVDRFCASLSAQLNAAGVESARVAVFGDVALSTPSERKGALAAIDVLLDATPVANGETAFAAVLAGCPMVTNSYPPNGAAALFREAGVTALVSESTDAYIAEAVKLGRDSAYRSAVAAEIARAGRQLALRYDSFALGESIGQALESSFDRIMESRKAFRAENTLVKAVAPESAAAVLDEAQMFIELGALQDAENRFRTLLLSDHDGVDARRRLAAVLTRQGHHTEAADLLVTVVEQAVEDPVVWVELGLAARQAGKVDLAVQALQTGVRIDPSRVDSWQVLAELAREVGNHDLLGQIEQVLRELGVTVPAPAPIESLADTLSTL